MSKSPRIRPATAGDLDLARRWLAAEGLPVDDLDAASMAGFIVASDASGPLGMVGLEVFGDCALLRSLVVGPEGRGSGVGRRLVAEIEAVASERGITELWLLTIDADRYFAALGYGEAPRSAAPEPIRATREFAELCPGDARLMRKQLAAGPR